MLQNVVVGGTGTYAAVPGYKVAGKTGTAQKPDAQGGYSSSAYVASFVGMVPASKPRLVILVTVDEPHGQIWGGVVAAPAFAQIARLRPAIPRGTARQRQSLGLASRRAARAFRPGARPGAHRQRAHSVEICRPRIRHESRRSGHALLLRPRHACRRTRPRAAKLSARGAAALVVERRSSSPLRSCRRRTRAARWLRQPSRSSAIRAASSTSQL